MKPTKRKAKRVIRIAIVGEITEETLQRFMYGTDPSGGDGFLFNNNAKTRFEVYLSSQGGGVDEGIAIYEMLRTSEAEVSITGYGIVGSIAALIFMAGHERALTPATRFFVHPGSIMMPIPENIFTVSAKTEEIHKLHTWYCHEMACRSRCDLQWMVELCSKDSFLSAHEALEMGIATKLSAYTHE